MHPAMLLTEAVVLRYISALQHDEVPKEFNAALLHFLPGAVGLNTKPAEVPEELALSSAAADAGTR